MIQWDTLQESMKKHGIDCTVFATRDAAVDYLNRVIDGETVGFGGSVTLQELGLFDTLKTHNQVIWHWQDPSGTAAEATAAPVYLSSLNGVAETGELINIDGSGNRVSATSFGPKRIYYIVGRNKVAPDLEQALWRARNIAAPKNAQRLGVKTPCAVKGDRCYDCNAPQRICRELLVTWRKPTTIEKMEVVLIDEDLGY